MAIYNRQLITSFDGKEMDISELTVNQLWSLGYEQEKSFVNLIKNTKPFSTERAALMKKAYETVNKISILRHNKERKKLYAYGATDSYIKLTKKIVKKIMSKKGKCLFFEAGVGTGRIINGVSGLKNVISIGCDIYVDKNFINPGLTVYECTIYEALSRLDNDSVDVFYWNDVMEHIPEDEIEGYIKLLSQKMSIGGIIITITPNRLKGPCDVTAHFEPRGTIAKGFHFHEYTFTEILTLFKKYNIESEYGVMGYVKKGWYILCSPKYIDRIKIFGERVFINFPYILRKILLVMMGCDVSILKNRVSRQSRHTPNKVG